MLFGIFVSSETKLQDLSILINIIWIPVLSVFIFFLSGVYRSVLRFIDISSIFLLFRSIFFVFLAAFLFIHFSFLTSILKLYFFKMRDFLIKEAGSWAFTTPFSNRIFNVIIFYQSNFSNQSCNLRIGSAGMQLAVLRLAEMQPIVFVDSDKSLHNTL